jgi:hypothetical protein
MSGVIAVIIYDIDDIISHEILYNQIELKHQFKDNFEKTIGYRPDTPEIYRIAVNYGGSVTAYNFEPVCKPTNTGWNSFKRRIGLVTNQV